MIRQILSVLLLISLALPVIQKTRHALEDHFEVLCQEDIPNHFHSREFDCSFDRFLSLPTDLRVPLSLDVPEHAFDTTIPGYTKQVFISNSTLHKNLRAPPALRHLSA